MNILSAAERLAAIDRAALRLDADRCLRARYPSRSAGDVGSCARCVDLCPTGALALGEAPASAPTFAMDQCAACLACLPACPAGALAAEDAVPAVLECAARTEAAEASAVELLCARHPTPDQGLSSDALGLRLRGCLAGLGVGAYVALAALGARRLVARTEACAQCEWRQLLPAINQQLEQARQLLAGRGFDGTVVSGGGSAATGVPRPLWEADNPPLSRRDLFRRLSRQSQVAAARAWAAGEAHIPGERGPGRDRRRIIRAIAALPVPTPPAEQPGDLLLDGDFAQLAISDACTACGVCARACPTGALRFEHSPVDGEERFALRLAPAECFGCGACVAVCAPAAIGLARPAAFAQVFCAPEPVTLASGRLARCQRCRALMAARPDQQLCDICAGGANKLASPHMPAVVRAALEARGLRR